MNLKHNLYDGLADLAVDLLRDLMHEQLGKMARREERRRTEEQLREAGVRGPRSVEQSVEAEHAAGLEGAYKRVKELEVVVNDGMASINERLDNLAALWRDSTNAAHRSLAHAATPERRAAEADPERQPIPAGASIWDPIDRRAREAGGAAPPERVMPAPGVFGHPDKPATEEQLKENRRAMAGVPAGIPIVSVDPSKAGADAAP